MATHSSVLAWRIPGAEEPGGLSSTGSHRVRHDWSDLACMHACTYLFIFRFFFPQIGHYRVSRRVPCAIYAQYIVLILLYIKSSFRIIKIKIHDFILYFFSQHSLVMLIPASGLHHFSPSWVTYLTCLGGQIYHPCIHLVFVGLKKIFIFLSLKKRYWTLWLLIKYIHGTNY